MIEFIWMGGSLWVSRSRDPLGKGAKRGTQYQDKHDSHIDSKLYHFEFLVWSVVDQDQLQYAGLAIVIVCVELSG